MVAVHSARRRIVVFLFGLVLVVMGLVFADYVNVLSLEWGDTELFGSVVSTLLTVIGGFVCVKAIFRM